MRALLLIRDPQAREMLSFALHAEPNTEVVAHGAVHKAIDEMLEGKEFDLIVVELSEHTGKLLKFLTSLTSSTPIIFVKSEPDYKKDPELERLNIIGELDLNSAVTGLKIALAKSKLSTVVEAMGPNDFIRVQTTLLGKLIPLEADIFIRLSPKKYIRIFQKGDVFTESDLERYYLRKNVEYFYYRKTDADIFLKRLDEFVSNTIKRGIQDKEVPGLFAEVADLFFSLTDAMPVTAQMVHFVENSVGTVIEGVRKKPLLADLLASMDMNKGSYRAVHSSLVAHVAGVLAVKLNWESNSTLQKLSFAALFHDLALTTDELARVANPIECMDLSEDPAECEKLKSMVINHPKVVGEFLNQYDDIPPEVDQIISQHHEKPDGSGFPLGLNHSQMSPLGALFLVAHEVVHMHMELHLSIPEIVDKLPAAFKQGVFKRITQALKNA